jgi:predicted O-methyltransferase YrrM
MARELHDDTQYYICETTRELLLDAQANAANAGMSEANQLLESITLAVNDTDTEHFPVTPVDRIEGLYSEVRRGRPLTSIEATVFEASIVIADIAEHSVVNPGKAFAAPFFDAPANHPDIPLGRYPVN